MATSSISALDLINLSKDVAQLNLGYLGVSVGVLTVLGGIFVYFNLNPLRDSLSKQEKSIEDLRKEAHGLLDQSRAQSRKELNQYKEEQSKLLSIALRQQQERVDLNTVNRIQEIENTISYKIEDVSEGKDVKLREIVLSETTNRLASLEKDLLLKLGSEKEIREKSHSDLKTMVLSLKAQLKDLSEKAKELQVFMYDNKGQMGAVMTSIELLGDAIDEYEEFKKAGIEKVGVWKVNRRLNELGNQLEKTLVDTENVSDIEEQFSRLSRDSQFKSLIDIVRSKIDLKKSLS